MQINYVHIDSRNRTKNFKNIHQTIHKLESYPIAFTNSSSLIEILIPDHSFNVDDKIKIHNVVSKNLLLDNILSVKKYSNYIRVHHINHGLSWYGRFDPRDDNQFQTIEYVDTIPNNFNSDDDIPDLINQYYILKNQPNLFVELSDINNIDNDMIGNIPINYLNNNHQIHLLFYKNGDIYYHDPDSYLIKLRRPSTINYVSDTINPGRVHIKFHNLYGIPLNYINNSDTSKPYSIIKSITKNTIIIDTDYPAIVDPNITFYTQTDINDSDIVNSNRGGGVTVYMHSIIDFHRGYPIENDYVYYLEKTYHQIKQAKLISSIFPNSQNSIDNNNNKLYWRNLNDGNHIYKLSIHPGNYSPKQLENAIGEAFNNIPYNQHINDKKTKYDTSGNYKFHLVNVNISDNTNLVTMESYRELVQIDDPMDRQILTVYDNFIQMSTNINIFNMFGADSIYKTIEPFMPNDDKLFFYFTETSYPYLDNKTPYSYHNLYIYYDSDNTNNLIFKRDSQNSILFNFYRMVDDENDNSINELKSFNTTTLLTDFIFNYQNNQITKNNHNLKIGNILVTDQFINPKLSNGIYTYQITKIIDYDNFIVEQSNNYKFIYDNVLLNFTPYVNNVLPQVKFIDNIITIPQFNNIMRIYHPNHQLIVGDNITISNSKRINNVPADIINATHSINKILSNDYYEVELGLYVSQPILNEYTPNVISLKYPNMFQLLFNCDDTIGPILGFSKTTQYNNIISNQDQSIKKLSMTGDDYFYLCCPELAAIPDTLNVQDIFTIIKLSDLPGSVLYDTFVPIVKYFREPYPNLNKLHFTMRRTDGSLVNFNGLDHSFIIELIGD